MEDKNFLGYFHELATHEMQVKKQAAFKIVETLSVADALSKTQDYSHLDPKIVNMLQKYTKGDFGAKVSADLSYSLKKLISGIITQLENSVQGYFLTLTLVLKRFKSTIDFQKLIKYTVDETGIGKAQLKSEKKAFQLGRLLVFSSIIEAGVFQDIKKTKDVQELSKLFFYELSKLWNQQPAFRESIMKVIEKTIQILVEVSAESVNAALASLTKYVLLKPTDNLSKPNDVLKHKIATDADCLSLFILCKDTIKQLGSNVSEDPSVQAVQNWNIKDDQSYVFEHMKKMLIADTVVNAFPRPHGSIKALITYFVNNKGRKSIKEMWKVVFENYCFNENLLYEQDINKRAKISLNNLGFYVFQYILDSGIKHDTIISLLTPNFVRMWVNRINKKRKNKLPSVQELDDKFKEWIKANVDNIDPAVRLNLITKLFGPNPQRRFTFKSNLTLFTLISKDLTEEVIQEYIKYAEELFKKPNLSEFYPEGNQEESSSDEDPDEAQKLQTNKEDNIRIYVLNLLVNTVMIFENHTETTLKEIVNFLVYQAYFQESLTDRMKEFAKDKLFALVDGLHKRKSTVEFKDDITSQSLGLSFTNTFLESKSLWLTEINKTIGRYAVEGNQFNTLDQVDLDKTKKKTEEVKDNKHDQKMETHKAYMDFGNQIRSLRKKIYKRLGKIDTNDKERKEKCRGVFKKICGFEILVFALALFCPVTPDETKEDLTELDICYQKLGLEAEVEEARTGKRVKISEDQEADKEKAYEVLFDFLISLLTRQNSTLRDITNFTFKAFCAEMNEGSLQNILSILNTPNVEANKIIITEEEEQPLMEVDEEDDEEEEEEASDISEDEEEPDMDSEDE